MTWASMVDIFAEVIVNRYKWAKFEGGGGSKMNFCFCILLLVSQSTLNSAYKIKEIIEKIFNIKETMDMQTWAFYTTLRKDNFYVIQTFAYFMCSCS